MFFYRIFQNIKTLLTEERTRKDKGQTRIIDAYIGMDGFFHFLLFGPLAHLRNQKTFKYD